MQSNRADTKTFFIRVAVTVIAVIVVMYLAKIWFIDRQTLATSEPGAAQKQAKVISWQDAKRYYNKYVTIEGTIVATHNTGKVCFLNFHPNYKRYFTAVIFASAFESFPEKPEEYYYGKKVRVSGYVKEYNGKPEMVLNYPSQIQAIE